VDLQGGVRRERPPHRPPEDLLSAQHRIVLPCSTGPVSGSTGPMSVGAHQAGT
jgi:hypothetical protein